MKRELLEDLTPRRRAMIAGGAAGTFALTGLLIGDYWLHQAWLFWLWLGGGAVSLWALAHGLNSLRQGWGSRLVAGVLALGIFLLIAVPYLTDVVLGSFLERKELLDSTPHIVPSSFTGQWYSELWNTPGFTKALENSLLVATLASLLTTLFGLFGAYAIARLRFPGRTAVYNVVMLSYMLPGIALIIPLVFIFRWWGNSFGVALIDQWYGMVVGHVAILLPFIVWLLVGTFEGVEPDVENAGRTDGATRVRVIRSVLLPMTFPSVVTVLVFAFILSWNEFLVSKVLYISQTPMLAPTIVNLMDPINRVEPKLAAAGVIASIPVLLLALLMQRYIVREIATGSVK
jgi:ABC-type glycerol-3-phosphate transport system permease component